MKQAVFASLLLAAVGCGGTDSVTGGNLQFWLEGTITVVVVRGKAECEVQLTTDAGGGIPVRFFAERSQYEKLQGYCASKAQVRLTYEPTEKVGRYRVVEVKLVKEQLR
jgi:hypothetical protein